MFPDGALIPIVSRSPERVTHVGVVGCEVNTPLGCGRSLG